jgi:transcriptional regulator with XRE-family HTH domain
MDAASRLGRYLKRAKLTQTAFAERSGIPQCQISLYVRRVRKPGRRNASRIEDATGGAVPASSWDDDATAASHA